MKKAILVSALFLSSCATITHGPNQDINVSIIPPVKASCDLSSHEYTQNIVPPASLTIPRSSWTMIITCHPADGSADGELTVHPRVEIWNALGDGLTTGFLAILAEEDTINRYPENLIVRLGAKNDDAYVGEFDNKTHYNQ